MKKNILLLATLFISSGQLFGLEQRQNSITSYSQENSSNKEATNRNSDSIQSGINPQELLSFAANFVANNPEAINNVNPPASGSSSSSSIFPQNALLPIMIDKKEKPSHFRCPLCNIYDEGRPKKTIINHITTHTQEKQFKCSLCTTKKFKTNANLQRHIKSTHHKSEQFKCPECERNFRRRDVCLKHMKNFCKTSKTLIKLTSASLQSASSSSTVLSQEMIDDSQEEEDDNDSDFPLTSASSSSSSFGITHINMKDLAAVTHSSVFYQNKSSASSNSSSTLATQGTETTNEIEDDTEDENTQENTSKNESLKKNSYYILNIER